MSGRLFQWLNLPPGIWETLMVGLICALVLLPYSSVGRMEVHFDEGEWISTSYYLEEFVSGNFRSPVWNVNYWTQTQPPVTRYILGVGRLAAGYTRADLNPARPEGGEQVLNMPKMGLLRVSRLTMSLLTSAAAAMLFAMLGIAFGRFAAYPFAILWGASSYIPRVGARAMGDAPLLFFSVLTVWSVFRAAQNPTDNLKKS